MEIHVYTPELQRIGQIDSSTSLLWNRKYFEPGTFELHVPNTSENIKMLNHQNIISKSGSKEAGVVESISMDENTMTVSGRFLSSYMDRRLIKGTVNYNGTVENAMRSLLSSATSIPLVELGKANGFAQTVSFQATYKNLLMYEEKLALCSNIGFRFLPDFQNKKIIFQTYSGIDHTVHQSTNGRVIFSEDYGNVSDPKYDYSDTNLRTLAIIGGEGEGQSRAYVTIGSGSGLGLRELFVDAKDIQKGDLSDADYKNLLIQRGNEKLAENRTSESFESSVMADINFHYRQDYDLGDLVTIKKTKWNMSIDKRITGITEVWEHEIMYVQPTFGDPLPDKIDWSDD